MRSILTHIIRTLLPVIITLGFSFSFIGCMDNIPGNKPYDILVIHSYRKDCQWAPELNKGIDDCFKKYHISTSIRTFYLNCEYLIADEEISALTNLLNEYENNAPDLILVCDDQATYSLLKTEHPFTYSVPIVFSGVDYPNYPLINLHPNVTGFITEPDFLKCYELIQALYPDTKIILNINSSFLGRQAAKKYEEQIHKRQKNIPLSIHNMDSISGISLMWGFTQGHRIIPKIFPVWDMFYSGLSRTSHHPTFSVNNEGFGNGYLGGYITPSYKQTYQATERAIDILKGKPVKDLPIEASPKVLMFDWKEMQRFHITKKQLPAGSVIAYMPYTVKYKNELILIAILAILIISGFTLYLIYLYKEEKKSKQEAQKHLKEHRDKLKIIMQSVREGVISIDKEMKIFAINPPALRWLKLKGDQKAYLGRNLLSLINISIPGKKYYLKEMITSVFTKHRNTHFEYATQLTSLDEQWIFPVIGELSGIYENNELYGMVITFHDITKDFTQKEFLALTLGSGNISSWHFDFESRRIIFDKSFFHLFNVEDDGSHSIPFEDLAYMIHPEDKNHWEEIYIKIKSGQISQCTLQMRIDFNGMGYKWWENRLSYLPPTTSYAYPLIFGLCLSIHQFKQTEEELHEARIKAQQSDKLKSAFLANMSHEIRTPLNAIVGFSNLLTSDEEYEPEEKQLFIETIQNNCNHLLALLTDILDLARIESETMSFKEEVCDLNEIINQIFLTQQVIIPNHLQLLKDIPQQPVIFKTDKLRLTQVITNLINNAVKFTEKGSVTVGYTCKEDGYIYLFVEDTGKGIPEKDLQNVFQRFFKKDDLAQGAGLGLSICKMIVDHFKGSIDVTSQVGVGSRFTVKIPYMSQPISHQTNKIIESTNNKSIKMETMTTEPTKNNRVTILIAEDEESNYLLLKTILQKRCNLFRARTGVEAIKIYNEHPEIDMILMDIKMPEMNGIDTVKEIRKVSQDIPIVMQSAYVFDSDMEKAKEAGASGFLTKPISVKILKETILKYFPFIEW
ncbi:ABC transporter substrate binding protein [Parabacteroides pacaensis]|uniref:ABC transporter substrate binding protein n=1 Tax=Parabacteroides pacaensis TaxID=2086575 RepID=UPI000D112A1C|nr:ABC transporter substrate binding protein [Parabacteroides pacaensis]